jgi:hypothetical protein
MIENCTRFSEFPRKLTEFLANKGSFRRPPSTSRPRLYRTGRPNFASFCVDIASTRISPLSLAHMNVTSTPRSFAYFASHIMFFAPTAHRPFPEQSAHPSSQLPADHRMEFPGNDSANSPLIPRSAQNVRFSCADSLARSASEGTGCDPRFRFGLVCAPTGRTIVPQMPAKPREQPSLVGRGSPDPAPSLGAGLPTPPTRQRVSASVFSKNRNLHRVASNRRAFLQSSTITSAVGIICHRASRMIHPSSVRLHPSAFILSAAC